VRRDTILDVETSKMRLLTSKMSPFGRKVSVAAIEKGIESRIEIVPTAVGQAKTNLELMEHNPIGKVPTLVTDEGQAIFDSVVIIDYLDGLQPQPRLIPESGEARLRALRLNAIADGLLVAGVLAKTEAARPPERQWPEMHAAQWAKVQKCLAALEIELGDAAAAVTVGEIAAGCAVNWMVYRAPEENWRANHPRLSKWFDDFARRDSMVRTNPIG
jgi:glutathione S-transferase